MFKARGVIASHGDGPIAPSLVVNDGADGPSNEIRAISARPEPPLKDGARVTRAIRALPNSRLGGCPQPSFRRHVWGFRLIYPLTLGLDGALASSRSGLGA